MKTTKKYIFLLPFLLGLSVASAQTKNAGGLISNNEKDTPLSYVEKMPSFPGGSEAMNDFIRNNIKYPPRPENKQLEGVVYVQFIVERNGELTNIKTLRGIEKGKDYDKAAENVVKNMPPWIPGEQKNNKVRVQFVLPIRFLK